MPYKDPEKQKEYAKKYRQENKKKLRQYNALYRKENPERVKQIGRKAGVKFYQNHIDEMKKKYIERNASEDWKEYHAKWYEANKDRILEKEKQRWAEDEDYRKNKLNYMKQRRLYLTETVNDMKAVSGCVRCGEADPICLDFHHKDPNEKLHGISRLVQQCNSLDMILKEIEKCEVLCSNCHRKHHNRSTEL